MRKWEGVDPCLVCLYMQVLLHLSLDPKGQPLAQKLLKVKFILMIQNGFDFVSGVASPNPMVPVKV